MGININKIKNLIKKKNYKISSHAQYRKAIRKIKNNEIEEAILSAKIVEEKLDDKPYPSCLIQGKTFNERIINVALALNEKDNFVIIITIYEYEEDEWKKYLKRKERNK